MKAAIQFWMSEIEDEGPVLGLRLEACMVAFQVPVEWVSG